MKKILYLFFYFLLTFIVLSCLSETTNSTTIKDIKDYSTRYSTLKKVKELSIVFFDENGSTIDQNKFNQKMAENTFIALEKVTRNNKEVHLITLQKYAANLEGKTLKKLAVQDLNGVNYTNESLLEKVTILSFWSISSDVDIKEMQQLNSLAQKYQKDSNIIWLAPSPDPSDLVSYFLKNKDWQFNIVTNQKKLALKLGILSYPTHLIINQKGEIKKVIAKTKNIVEEINLYIQKTLHD